MLKNYSFVSVLFASFLLFNFSSTAQVVPCENGFAGIYPCLDVNLYKFFPSAEIGGGIINDNWGWTSPVSGKEYAIQGRSNGTAFIDVSNPVEPIYLGNLPTHNFESLWRDVKVYNNHAFIVSEAAGHGMQVMDLLQLDDVTNPPVTFAELAHYPNFGNAHNVAINEETGYAYAVGSNTYAGGLHFVNIQDPSNPVGAGGFDADGYTHDVQVVIYHGSDPDYFGKEMAFASNEDTFTIIDVDDKSDPELVSRTGYSNSAYAHQGWLTEDHNYFLHDDELDELNFGFNTRTFVWDIHDLDAPVLLGYYESTSTAIDHNLYVKGNHVYLANYRSGLRVLLMNDLANVNLTEVGFFDVVPEDDNPSFSGSWNIYPFFESGTMVLSSMYGGCFILQPAFDPLTSAVNSGETVELSLFPNPANSLVTLRANSPITAPIEVFDFTGKRVMQVVTDAVNQGDVVIDVSSLSKGMYLVKTGEYTSKLVVN